jgi:hypothetical protein
MLLQVAVLVNCMMKGCQIDSNPAGCCDVCSAAVAVLDSLQIMITLFMMYFCSLAAKAVAY